MLGTVLYVIWPRFFCGCFSQVSVPHASRTADMVIIINISCNTVIRCHEHWSIIVPPSLAGRWKSGGWGAFDCFQYVWWMIKLDKWFTVVNCPLTVCGSAMLRLWQLWESSLITGLFPTLYWFPRKINLIQTVMGNLGETLILQRDFFAPLKRLQLFAADGCLGLIPDFWLLLEEATFNSPLLLFALKRFLDSDSSQKLASCLLWTGALWVTPTDVAAWFCRISRILCHSTLINAVDASHPPHPPPDSSSGQTLVSFQWSSDWCSLYQWAGFDIKPLRLFSTCVPRLWSMARSQDGEWSPDWTSSGIWMLNNCPLNRGMSWIIHGVSPIGCLCTRTCREGPRSGREYGICSASKNSSSDNGESARMKRKCGGGQKTAVLIVLVGRNVFRFLTLMNKTNIKVDILLLGQNINWIFRPVISPTFLSRWMSYSYSWCSTLTFWITSQRL